MSYTSPSERRRAKPVALTILVELLFLLALIGLATRPHPRTPTSVLKTFGFAPPAVERAARRPETSATSAAPRPPIVPPPTPIPHPPVPVPVAPPMLDLSAEEFAASDIGKLKGRGSGKAAYGPGEGPGGVSLYNAEWVREPRDAELAPYLPEMRQAGAWAMVACRTVERFHVDNCQSLGEFPLGSGLARGLRLAAWQFLVRPPRVGDKPMVGAWVRIRFDFTTRKVS